MFKNAAIILGIALALISVFIASAFISVAVTTAGAIESAENFLTLVNRSDPHEAYINASPDKNSWNVYDGDKLINLKREFNVLNYFSKYGFEYYKRKYTGKGKKYIILKNNNN